MAYIMSASVTRAFLIKSIEKKTSLAQYANKLAAPKKYCIDQLRDAAYEDSTYRAVRH